MITIKAKKLILTVESPKAEQVIEIDNPRPTPVGYATAEGGKWHDWKGQTNPHYAAHAIKFSDGSIFDMINGWRE